MSNRVSKEELGSLIRSHRFSDLFIQLGWDQENLSSEPLLLTLNNGQSFSVKRVVEKRGFVVCVCDAGENYPTSTNRKRLISQLARHHYEHLLIICGEEKQCWTMAIRPQNRPMRTVEAKWHEGQDIQVLMEKLKGLLFDITEEEQITITDVVDRVRHAFMQNAETVTRRFYARFKEELSNFTRFIEGIRDQVPREWYAALMLNRLMFIYFIQKKGFLDGDVNYLRNRLEETKQKFGADKFHSHFYSHFLRRLFFEGLGQQETDRNPELKELLGRVPYLNGGLFDLHEIEQKNKTIEIKDIAFENLFDFFDQYRWHLDSRATASGRDINPDVIGYIFEKYINDRASMGAYYTQEDITGYIARNTIIPLLLSRAKEKCANAFEHDRGIWRFLREDPDNYIYDAVKKGCDVPDEEIPENIRCGIDSQATNLIERRKDWNTLAEERFALPTEIWRETIARRQRYFALKAKMRNGEICEIDDLITYNLDVERFAQDALRYYEGSDFIDAFFQAIAGSHAFRPKQQGRNGITVLDPACGSGAFLFAALNVLEPLYERCIERMRDFVDDELKKSEIWKEAKKHMQLNGVADEPAKQYEKYQQFSEVLENIKTHPNKKYWIYKTIMLNNLYGVDLMREAVEIAKLRLFLKLAAEAEYDWNKDNLGLEPLPDIDFNIRSGNSLVGFASMKQFEESASVDTSAPKQQLMDISKGLIDEVRSQAAKVQKVSEQFKRAQDAGGKAYRQKKQELKKQLGNLNDKMNRCLADYYVKDEKRTSYEQWLQSHRPFHWLAEFYGIIEGNGGFDAVIGNPPYVEYSKVKKDYTIRDYKTESCGNLYAIFIERVTQINTGYGTFGMIVQLPLVCTDRMIPAQEMLSQNNTWFANFDDRPGKLFADLTHIRATILLTTKYSKATLPTLYTTKYKRWYSEVREAVFDDILFSNIKKFSVSGTFLKLEDKLGRNILGKLNDERDMLPDFSTITRHVCNFHNAPGYWIRATNFIPYFWNEKDGEKCSTHIKQLFFENNGYATMVCALLNSSLFYWWFILCSNCRDLSLREIQNFPFNLKKVSAKHYKKLTSLVDELMVNYRAYAVRKKTNYRTTGRVVYDEFYPRHSKRIIDEIDTVLAKHYGFTEEELDYIISYDIKYRMGLGQ